MKKLSLILAIILLLAYAAPRQLFADGEDLLAQNYLYLDLGPTLLGAATGGFGVGVGYEHALGSMFSLGGYVDFLFYDRDYYSLFATDLLLRGRWYPLKSSLERLFVGTRLGAGMISGDYSSGLIFTAGLDAGWKFVFGNPNGFSLEPAVGFSLGGGSVSPFYLGITFGYAWGGGAAPPKPAPAPAAPRSAKEGVYIGIITLASNAEDITGGAPILLDQAGYTRLKSLINSRYQMDTKQGTALFYAEHLALANLRMAETSLLPKQLESVNIITFTDGLDNTSTGFGLTPINDSGTNVDFGGQDISVYLTFVQNEIRSRKINDQKITSYVVGVRGNDVTNEELFQGALKAVAYPPMSKAQRDPFDNPTVLAGYKGVSDLFASIANSIVNQWTTTKFSIVTPSFPGGTKIRMTFNGESMPAQAARAAQYLDGEITVRGREYWLTNIKCGGGISVNEKEVKGELRGTEVVYLFENIKGYSGRDDQIHQFSIAPRSTEYQHNSEFNPKGATTAHVQKNNAVIYLVLDQSRSLRKEDGTSEIEAIRKAAQDFIDHIYQSLSGK